MAVATPEILERIAQHLADGTVKVQQTYDLAEACEALQVLGTRSPPAPRQRHARLESTASPAPRKRNAEDALFAGVTEQQREQLRGLLIALRDTSRTEPTDDNCEFVVTRR